MIIFKDYLSLSKTTVRLAFPVMLSQLGQVLVGVADSVMVGRIGTVPLAGASLGNSIFVLFLTFGIGISFGITPLVAKADGEKNVKMSIDILKHGLLINIATGLILFSLLLLTTFLLPHLNQPDRVVRLALPYFIIISLSIVPFMIFQTFRQFTEGLSFTKQAMIITVSGNILNIVLNYVLIFGKMGFSPYGLTGAGIATLISRIVMALMMGIYVLYRKDFRKYWSEFSVKPINIHLLKSLLNIGLPSGFQFIFEVGAFSFAAIMIGWIGTIALAAHQVAVSLASLTYMMASGIATATTIRVGNQLGRKDISMLRKVGYNGFLLSGIFMGLNGVILILTRHFLASLYINDPEVINLAASLILVAAFFQISDGLQVVGLGALRGMADVRIPTWITLLAYWILALPIGYVTGILLSFGALGVWIGLLAGLTVTAILLILRFKRVCMLKRNQFLIIAQ